MTFPPLSTRLFAAFLLAAALAPVCAAQQPFPGEPAAPPQQSQPAPQQQQPALPPDPIPDDQFLTPTIHVNTTVVLVPTLVEKKSGEVLYGLQPKDFTLLDNGVPQTVHVDEDLDSQPPYE